VTIVIIELVLLGLEMVLSVSLGYLIRPKQEGAGAD
jgi:hypothetical protein